MEMPSEWRHMTSNITSNQIGCASTQYFSLKCLILCSQNAQSTSIMVCLVFLHLCEMCWFVTGQLEWSLQRGSRLEHRRNDGACKFIHVAPWICYQKHGDYRLVIITVELLLGSCMRVSLYIMLCMLGIISKTKMIIIAKKLFLQNITIKMISRKQAKTLFAFPCSSVRVLRSVAQVSFLYLSMCFVYPGRRRKLEDSAAFWNLRKTIDLPVQIKRSLIKVNKLISPRNLIKKSQFIAQHADIYVLIIDLKATKQLPILEEKLESHCEKLKMSMNDLKAAAKELVHIGTGKVLYELLLQKRKLRCYMLSLHGFGASESITVRLRFKRSNLLESHAVFYDDNNYNTLLYLYRMKLLNTYT